MSKRRPVIRIAIACMALVFLPIVGVAGPLLPQTLHIDTEHEGISVRYPADWSVAQPTMNTGVISNAPADQQETAAPSVRIQIGYLERTDHADAVSQLAEYANESRTPSTFLTIGGWPALQRVQSVERPQPSRGPVFPDRMMVQITTAVAAGNLLVRLEAGLPSDADEALKDLVLAIGQSLTFTSTGDPAQVQQELNKLKSSPGRSTSPRGLFQIDLSDDALAANLSAGASTPIFPPTQFANFQNGEQEVAVSNNGAVIVVARQAFSVASTDGGKNFTAPLALGVGDGDSSVAIGQSGNFYHAGLFGGACPAGSNCAEIASLGTNGQTVGPLRNAATCLNTTCNVDQEHIAADRVNAAAGSLDRVYMALRIGDSQNRFGPGFSVANVTCSPDSGATWSPLFPLENPSDFPRVTVGQDGFFYVVYTSSGAASGNIRIDKFNPCPALSNAIPPTVPAMTRAAGGYPKTVSAFTSFAGCQVTNGFGGLDRCNNGNVLSSPTVAVDDKNANHVYVAWANNTAANNDSIMVADSTNDAAFGTPVTINGGGAARRFMPWVCATGGSAFVTWYDRRASVTSNPARNDLTDYFAASAGLNATNALVANNDEFKISGASDQQCVPWPAAPRSKFDVLNCSPQPAGIGTGTLGGICKLNPVPTPDTSSNRACNYSLPDATACPITATITQQEVCRPNGTGFGPKYGDYNGNACLLGRLYSVFASGVSPAGAPLGANVVNNFFQSFVVSSTPTTLTYSGATSEDYHDAATLSAALTLSGTSSPVAGQTITFTIGTQTCTGVTNAAGAASCTLTLNQVPGPYTLTASFAGSGNFQASSASVPFTITREETTLSYTGDTVIANNTTAHLSGVLLEDGLVPIAGRTVVFTLGTGASAQTCTGTTNAAGVAACTIFPVNQPFGAGIVADSFAGDAFYLPSSASATTIIFAFLPRGAFVLGDQTAVVGPNTVEFWGFDWALQNVLSGGPAPDSFKGFASSISTNPPACGDTWPSKGGNSSGPPDVLPPFMGVVVSSTIHKSGSTISGNVPKIVVVQTNSGYAPNPGHPGTGIVVAVYCK
jgi:hypothetical protein